MLGWTVLLHLCVNAFFNPLLYLEFRKPSKCLRVKENGAKCARNSHCRSNYCKDKICLPLPQLGQQCEPRSLCAEGFGCTNWFDGRCVPVAKVGEKCQLSDSGYYHCDEGLLCYEGICQSAKSVNDECSDDGKCAEGLVCVNELDSLAKSCQPKSLKGKYCGSDEQCARGLYCNTFWKKCQRLQGKYRWCSDNSCKEGYYCPSRFRKIQKKFGPSAKEVKSTVFSVAFPRFCKSLPVEGEDCFDKCAPGYFCPPPQVNIKGF